MATASSSGRLPLIPAMVNLPNFVGNFAFATTRALPDCFRFFMELAIIAGFAQRIPPCDKTFTLVLHFFTSRAALANVTRGIASIDPQTKWATST
jgi:hypothetical protein